MRGLTAGGTLQPAKLVPSAPWDPRNGLRAGHNPHTGEADRRTAYPSSQVPSFLLATWVRSQFHDDPLPKCNQM